VYCSQTMITIVASRSRLVCVGGREWGIRFRFGEGVNLLLFPGTEAWKEEVWAVQNKIRIPWQPSPARGRSGLLVLCTHHLGNIPNRQPRRPLFSCLPAQPTDRRVGGPTLSETYHITRRAAGFPFLFPRNPRPPKPTPSTSGLVRLEGISSQGGTNTGRD
jgi:hypothetical protein